MQVSVGISIICLYTLSTRMQEVITQSFSVVIVLSRYPVDKDALACQHATLWSESFGSNAYSHWSS